MLLSLHELLVQKFCLKSQARGFENRDSRTPTNPGLPVAVTEHSTYNIIINNNSTVLLELSLATRCSATSKASSRFPLIGCTSFVRLNKVVRNDFNRLVLIVANGLLC